MRSIFGLIFITTMTIWDTAQLVDASPFKSKKLNVVQLYEKNAAAGTRLMENLVEKYPDSITPDMKVDTFLEKRSAVSATVQDQLAREQLPAPQTERNTKVSGSFMDSFSEGPNYAYQSLYHEGGPLASQSYFLSDPDANGSVMMEAAGLTVNETGQMTVNYLLRQDSQGISGVTTTILYLTNLGIVSGLNYEDEHIGLVSMGVGPVSSEVNSAIVAMGPYQFEETYDIKTACKVYKICSVAGCTILD